MLQYHANIQLPALINRCWTSQFNLNLSVLTFGLSGATRAILPLCKCSANSLHVHVPCSKVGSNSWLMSGHLCLNFFHLTARNLFCAMSRLVGMQPALLAPLDCTTHPVKYGGCPGLKILWKISIKNASSFGQLGMGFKMDFWAVANPFPLYILD